MKLIVWQKLPFNGQSPKSDDLSCKDQFTQTNFAMFLILERDTTALWVAFFQKVLKKSKIHPN
jgi:hypothetical protein